MHRIFYVIGSFALLTGVFMSIHGINNRVPANGYLITQMGLMTIFGGIVWLGMARALELLERIAFKVAPLDRQPPKESGDWEFDKAGNVRRAGQQGNKWAAINSVDVPETRNEPKL